jgi:hypothetical protein
MRFYPKSAVIKAVIVDREVEPLQPDEYLAAGAFLCPNPLPAA